MDGWLLGLRLGITCGRIRKELNFVCAIVGKITRILSGMDDWIGEDRNRYKWTIK